MIEYYSSCFRAESAFITAHSEKSVEAGLISTLDVCANYAAEMVVYNMLRAQGDKSLPSPRWLTVSGKSGNGKTMLSREIFEFVKKYAAIRSVGVSERIKFGELVGYDEHPEYNGFAFYEFAELAEMLRSGKGCLQEIQRAYFLVIDDLGAEKNTEFLTGKILSLLNARMNQWTFISTNMSRKDIAEALDSRIASRITRDGNTHFTLAGPDYCAEKFRMGRV